MAKRLAAYELNDRNWDKEEKSEEDTMKQRTVIKAKRRSTGENATSESSRLFSSFSGFCSRSPVSRDKSKTGKVSPPGNIAAPTPVNGSEESGAAQNLESRYLRNLKALNESLMAWVKKHVEKDPYCILTPVFRDYEEHLKKLDKPLYKSSKTDSGYGKSDKTASPAKDVAAETVTTSSVAMTMESSLPTSSLFTGFKFNSKPADTLSTSTFSFSASKLAESTPKEVLAGGSAEDNEEYQPPVAEVKEIKEDGAVFSQRCKLFYNREGSWLDKGVGNLYLKQLDNRGQLIIRANTNLGNILLNIYLAPSMQLKRQGKNNVSLVCVPNPPFSKEEGQKTVVPMLIRVKTSKEADCLLQKMEEIKMGKK